MKALQYIKARLSERSTWLLIGSGVGTAALLPMPWSVVSAVVHTVAALVPDGTLR
jgi:hypothetical protein